MTGRSAAEDLLGPLVADPQHLASISHAEPHRVQALRGHLGRLGRLLLVTLGPGPGRLGLADRVPGPTGQADLGEQLGLVGVINPQAQGLTDAPLGLADGPAVGVAAGHLADPGQPCPRLVALIDHRVLAPAHRNHLALPTHGARSRSILRSVPAGMSSPRWTGTVVAHLPLDPHMRTLLPDLGTSELTDPSQDVPAGHASSVRTWT